MSPTMEKLDEENHLTTPPPMTELKKGFVNNHTNHKHIIEKIYFHTSHEEGLSTFSEYIGRMKDGQDAIYYLMGRSLHEVQRSKFSRRFVEAGLEVMYMTNPILDGQVLSKLKYRYGGKRLVRVDCEGLELPLLDPAARTERRKRHKEALAEFQPLCKRIKAVFGDRFSKIVISNTLVESSCVVVDEDEAEDGSEPRTGSAEEEPYFAIGTGRFRLEINAESDALKLLCLQARVLERKQVLFDDTIRELFGPPNPHDLLVEEPQCDDDDDA